VERPEREIRIYTPGLTLKKLSINYKNMGSGVRRSSGIAALIFLLAFVTFSLSFNVAVSANDSDNDGLTDSNEAIWGTDPNNPDTDADGLLDGDEVLVYGSDPKMKDTDGDWLEDGVEVHFFGTNPIKESTDGDKYDDRQELLGHSPIGVGAMGGDMPTYVQAPGDNVFVAAYPVIGIDISNDIYVVLNQDITTEFRNISTYTQQYSVSNTEGSSMAVGKSNSHVYNSWMDMENSEADATNYDQHTDEITGTQTGFYNSTTIGNEKVFEHGVDYFDEVVVTGGVRSKITLEGKVPKGEVEGSLHRTITEQRTTYAHHKTGTQNSDMSMDYSGTNLEKTNGTSEGWEHVIGTAFSKGVGKEMGRSTTMTRTTYHETTVTNTNSIAQGHEWATATTINPSNAGTLRFTFFIENTGTDIANELNDLRFNVFVGNHLPITYPPTSQSGISLQNLNPGARVQYTGQVDLTLDEVRDIDEGQPVKIALASYSYGLDQIFYENAWGGDVLVEVDDGVDDGDETLDRYMTYMEFGDKYLDVLKRLNTSVQIRQPLNKRIELPLEVDMNDTIVSILGKPITDWSWWKIFLQKTTGGPQFSQIDAHAKTRMFLVYDQDTDHDFYTDRSERRAGTNKHDPDSHPNPFLIAGAYEVWNGTEVYVKVKFSNTGNYDAYGVEARLIPVDNDTIVHDNIIGGAGRIDPGQTIVPNDYFIYENKTGNYSKPLVLVLYNDPTGSHFFVTKIELSDLNESIDDMEEEMISVPELAVMTNPEHGYYSDNWIIAEYFNPSGETIHNATVFVEILNSSGHLKHQINETVHLKEGENNLLYTWNPSTFLNISELGEEYKVLVSLGDCQYGLIEDAIEDIEIVNYPSYPRLLDQFDDSSVEKSLVFSGPGTQTIWVSLPKNATVVGTSLEINGYDSAGSNPVNPWMEVGNADGIKEWVIAGTLQGNFAYHNMFNDSSQEKNLTFNGIADSETIWVELPGGAVMSYGNELILENTYNPTGNSLTIDGTTVQMYGNYTYDYVRVKNGGILQVTPYDGTPGTGLLNITAACEIRIDSTSKIEGVGNGFRGGAAVPKGEIIGNNGEGPGFGEGGGTSRGGGGAGYGGMGGDGGGGFHGGKDGSGGIVYGDQADFSFFKGSGGGSSGSQLVYPSIAGGDGGAGVYLGAPLISISGTINMNGADGFTGYTGWTSAGGGGSGGTVILDGIIMSIDNLAIEAKGGDGGENLDTYEYGGGGGGGGRIKIFYNTLSNSSISTNVTGGMWGDGYSGRDGYSGYNGTLYYEEMSRHVAGFRLDVSLDGRDDFVSDCMFPASIKLNAQVIEAFLESCPTNAAGLCELPLHLTSYSKGTLPIKGIRMIYHKSPEFTAEINQFLSTCTPDSYGNCKVPLNTYSDSQGILNISNLRIIYNTPNTPPIINFTNPGTATVSMTEGQNLSFAVDAYDPENHGLDIQWFIDGTNTGLTGKAYNYASNYDSAGQHAVMVTVSDGVFTVNHTWILTVNDYSLALLDIIPNLPVSGVGKDIIVNVSINTTADIYALQFEILFNQTVAEVSSVAEGHFLRGDGVTTFPVSSIDNSTGWLLFVDTRTGTQGISGIDGVATITFRTMNAGELDLALTNLKISDSGLNSIPFSDQGAKINVYRLAGDVNKDCIVDIFDLATVGITFGAKVGDPNWNPDADTHPNGLIDVFDLAVVGLHFSQIC
jgi:hypothetical protein